MSDIQQQLNAAELIQLITEENDSLTSLLESINYSEEFAQVAAQFTRHAAEEEQIMRQIQYPDYNEHKSDHALVLCNLVSGKTRRSVVELRRVVSNIIDDHIQKHDRKLLEFLLADSE